MRDGEPIGMLSSLQALPFPGVLAFPKCCGIAHHFTLVITQWFVDVPKHLSEHSTLSDWITQTREIVYDSLCILHQQLFRVICSLGYMQT